jgi:transposase-like protein
MYTSAERRAWLAHHEAMGANVAQTCRHYGISRATFYKWRARYDPAQPQKPLRSRSRRPRSPRKATWTQEALTALSIACALHPTWGRRRLHALVQADNRALPISERTVGRMLQRIKTRCPVCRSRHGRHVWWRHLAIPAPVPGRAQSSPPTPAPTTGGMQPVITRGLDALVRAWAAASPEARRLFRQQHAAAAETAAPLHSSAETEQHAKIIAALFQKQ